MKPNNYLRSVYTCAGEVVRKTLGEIVREIPVCQVHNTIQEYHVANYQPLEIQNHVQQEAMYDRRAVTIDEKTGATNPTHEQLLWTIQKSGEVLRRDYTGMVESKVEAIQRAAEELYGEHFITPTCYLDAGGYLILFAMETDNFRMVQVSDELRKLVIYKQNCIAKIEIDENLPEIPSEMEAPEFNANLMPGRKNNGLD